MRIFDSHCHIETGLDAYNIDVSGRNVIFNTIDAYNQYAGKTGSADSISVIFDYRNNFEEVKKLVSSGKANALKIHSRLQKIAQADYPALIEKLEELNPGLPIIIDSFFYGDEMDFQPDMNAAITIAKKFPQIPVIIAHAGGYNVLQYFYHLKSLENVYFELSFSLQYLRYTSAFFDIKNLLRFGSADKIIFGTDYPFADPKTELDFFMEISKDLNLSAEHADKILFLNAEKLFRTER